MCGPHGIGWRGLSPNAELVVWSRRIAALAFVVAVGSSLAGCRPVPSTMPAAQSGQELVRPADADGPLVVVHVSDGDTVTVRRDHQLVSVRLIGVDTPETKRPDTAVQCFGPEASRFTTSLAQGRQVWLERDSVAGTTDRYGRELAYVWIDGRVLLNEALITQGFGREYAYRNQNYAYRNAFRDAEMSAQATGAGLWGACAGG